MAAERATFLCSLPPTQNAIQVHGSGDGLRIVLDIPASEMAEAVKVIAWGQTVLRVTIEPEPRITRRYQGNGEKQHKLAARSEWQSEGQAQKEPGTNRDTSKAGQSDA